MMLHLVLSAFNTNCSSSDPTRLGGFSKQPLHRYNFLGFLVSRKSQSMRCTCSNKERLELSDQSVNRGSICSGVLTMESLCR